MSAVLALLAAIPACHLDSLFSDPPRLPEGEPSLPAAIEFIVQPGGTLVNEPIDPPPEIVVRDSVGAPDTTFNGPVSISLQAEGTDASLKGTATRLAVDGVVVFPGLAIDLPGEGYRLVAAIAGVPEATSAPFEILAPPEEGREPAELLIVSGNGQSGTAGLALNSAYVVRVNDSAGDPIPGVSVSWAVTTGGGTVLPASSTTDSNGQASATHTLGTATGAQSVRASVGSLAPVVFTATAVAGGASVLVFTVQPTDAVAGEAITPAVEVVAHDEHGNRASSFSGAVTLTLGGGGTVAGTTVRSATAGVVTFPGLSVSTAGSGYRLSASAPGVSGATSAAFDITAPEEEEPEPDAVVIVSGNGQTGPAGDALGAPYRVRVVDAEGDPVPGVSVTWAIVSGGGSVSPGSSTTTSGGEASATHTLGTGTGAQSVRATVSGLTPVTFTATAVAGSASVLVFTVQPSDADEGVAITPAVEVMARDEHGNRATAFTGTVTLTLASGGGGGALDGTTQRTASSGVASFPGVSISAAGTGYRLAATASGVSGATSAAFDIIAPEEEEPQPEAVVIVSGNGQGGTVGETLDDPYVVRVTDADGTPVAGVTVAWAVTSGGGSVGAGSSTTNSSGQASTTHTLGTGTGSQSVRATVAGLPTVTFTATAAAGAPAELVFTTQPSDAAMGETISPPVRVTVRDRFGNTVTNFSGSITLSIVPLSGTPLASLNGTRTRSASGGVATFDDLSIDLVGVLYRLRASGSGLSADSAPFDILLL